jgi:hypothetical protein
MLGRDVSLKDPYLREKLYTMAQNDFKLSPLADLP